jgi:hypothetical protein
MMGSALGAGVVLGLTAINPVVGAGAAAVMAVGEAVSFAMGHAGVKGSTPSGGELTIAAADKKSYAEKNPESYTDILGDTYNVGTGQKQKQAGPVDQKISNAVRDVSKDYSQDQIAGDVRSMMNKQMEEFGWAQKKLKDIGSDDPKTIAKLDMEGLNFEKQKPAPVALAAPKAFSFG